MLIIINGRKCKKSIQLQKKMTQNHTKKLQFIIKKSFLLSNT
jgi:hypothetical protein